MFFLGGSLPFSLNKLCGSGGNAIQEGGCACIADLASENDGIRGSFAHTECVKTIVHSMKTHPTSMAVQLKASSTLGDIFVSSDGACKNAANCFVEDMDGLELIHKTMINFTE